MLGRRVGSFVRSFAGSLARSLTAPFSRIPNSTIATTLRYRLCSHASRLLGWLTGWLAGRQDGRPIGFLAIGIAHSIERRKYSKMLPPPSCSAAAPRRAASPPFSLSRFDGTTGRFLSDMDRVNHSVTVKRFHVSRVYCFIDFNNSPGKSRFSPVFPSERWKRYSHESCLVSELG